MNKKITIFLFLVFSLCAFAYAENTEAVGDYPALPYKEFLFTSGIFPSSHAASIVELPDGELFAVWYSDTSRNRFSSIWSSRRPIGADKWTEPLLVHTVPNHSNKNPVLFMGSGKKLWLIWAIEKRGAFKLTVDTLWAKFSEDSGRTWSEERRLKTPIGFLPRNHPTKLTNGRLILPLYVNWSTSSAVIISDDGGLTWSPYRYMLWFFGIQPTIIERSDSTLFALTRTGMWPRLAWQAVSYNMGRNWKKQWPSNVDNPGTALEMIKLKNGHVVLAFNNSKKDLSAISLALSYDEGRTWPYARMIEPKSDNPNTYPAILEDKNGLIHVLYSTKWRSQIAHFVTDERWIKDSR